MKRSLIIIAFALQCITVYAQKTDTLKKKEGSQTSADSLLNSLSAGQKDNEEVNAFKGTRLIFSQSTRTVKKNNLNFLVLHRFGDIAGTFGGGKFAYGLDDVNDVYIGFEYGVSDNFNIDLGRSTQGQLIELGVKYALLHQTADGSSPVAISLVGQFGVRPYQSFPTFASRQSFLAQAVIARKFSSIFSFQVSPVIVRDNTPMPDVPGNEKNLFALMGTGRIAINNHMGFLVDYSHSFSSFRTGANGFTDPLGFGFEAETGGHVFTLNITNARAISEINSLSATTADYGRGQYRLGFTISRMFDFSHKNKKDK